MLPLPVLHHAHGLEGAHNVVGIHSHLGAHVCRMKQEVLQTSATEKLEVGCQGTANPQNEVLGVT